MLRLALKNPGRVSRIGAHDHHGEDIGPVTLQHPGRPGSKKGFHLLINMLAHRIGVLRAWLAHWRSFQGRKRFCLGLGSRRRRLGAIRTFRDFYGGFGMVSRSNGWHHRSDLTPCPPSPGQQRSAAGQTRETESALRHSGRRNSDHSCFSS